MKAETLIIVTLKNGTEKRVHSADEAYKIAYAFIDTIINSKSYVFKDVDQSWVIVNADDYLTIEIFPLGE